VAARLGLSKEEIRRLVLGKINVVYRNWGIEQTPFALAEARVRAPQLCAPVFRRSRAVIGPTL
jgi:hypothetical protein